MKKLTIGANEGRQALSSQKEVLRVQHDQLTANDARVDFDTRPQHSLCKIPRNIHALKVQAKRVR